MSFSRKFVNIAMYKSLMLYTIAGLALNALGYLFYMGLTERGMGPYSV